MAITCTGVWPEPRSAPPTAALGPEADGRCAGAGGCAPAVARVVGGRRRWRVCARVGKSAFL